MTSTTVIPEEKWHDIVSLSLNPHLLTLHSAGLMWAIYNNNVDKGFWPDPQGFAIHGMHDGTTARGITPGTRNFAEAIALAHSELDEAWVADGPDDKIKQHAGAVVEHVDAFIRGLDIIAGIEKTMAPYLYERIADPNHAAPFLWMYGYRHATNTVALHEVMKLPYIFHNNVTGHLEYRGDWADLHIPLSEALEANRCGDYEAMYFAMWRFVEMILASYRHNRFTGTADGFYNALVAKLIYNAERPTKHGKAY